MVARRARSIGSYAAVLAAGTHWGRLPVATHSPGSLRSRVDRPGNHRGSGPGDDRWRDFQVRIQQLAGGPMKAPPPVTWNPQRKLFTESFEAAKAAFATLLSPTTAPEA